MMRLPDITPAEVTTFAIVIVLIVFGLARLVRWLSW